MIRNLKKLFGVNDSAGGPDEASIEKRPEPKASHPMLTHEVIGQTLVVTLVEREMNAVSSTEVAYEIKNIYAHQPGVRHIVLDLENIKYVDSAGLNTMVDLMGTVRKRQGRLGIAAATQHVEVLFKLTRLELVFTIRRTVIEVIDAIEPRD
ncbi:MAG: STAS domain-containing protein [Phycisphaerales bacterium]|nr:STAS domain-containing protein [Phycisphaerales bacterium]